MIVSSETYIRDIRNSFKAGLDYCRLYISGHQKDDDTIPPPARPFRTSEDAAKAVYNGIERMRDLVGSADLSSGPGIQSLIAELEKLSFESEFGTDHELEMMASERTAAIQAYLISCLRRRAIPTATMLGNYIDGKLTVLN